MNANAKRSQIIALSNAGKRPKEIAAELGCSISWVWRVTHPQGGRKITPATKRKILHELELGLYSLRKIADRHKVHHTTVHLWQRQHCPYQPNSARPHRCPKCKALINTHKCVRCQS